MSQHGMRALPFTVPLPFLQTLGHQAQVSFVHSQVEMADLHGLEKRYRKRSAFEDHPQLL